MIQAELADLSRVDASQVSRILAGDFVTFGSAVVRICNILGVPPDAEGPKEPSNPRIATPNEASWSKVERAVRNLWDETPVGADRLVRVLDAIGAVGKGTSRRTTKSKTGPIRA